MDYHSVTEGTSELYHAKAKTLTLYQLLKL